jgi:hypothetical protein
MKRTIPMKKKMRFNTEENTAAVLHAYCDEPEKPTIQMLATRFAVSFPTIQRILSRHLSEEEYRAQKHARVSTAKSRSNHPNWGKTGSQHPNWKGGTPDARGRIMQQIGGRKHVASRVVFAEALGIHPRDLPQHVHTFRLDGDQRNNNLDNLALVTPAAHRQLLALIRG